MTEPNGVFVKFAKVERILGSFPDVGGKADAVPIDGSLGGSTICSCGLPVAQPAGPPAPASGGFAGWIDRSPGRRSHGGREPLPSCASCVGLLPGPGPAPGERSRTTFPGSPESSGADTPLGACARSRSRTGGENRDHFSRSGEMNDEITSWQALRQAGAKLKALGRRLPRPLCASCGHPLIGHQPLPLAGPQTACTKPGCFCRGWTDPEVEGVQGQ